MKKFYFLFLAMMVSLAANAIDYYLIGGFNGWAVADANSKFTDQGDGTYVLDYTGTLTSGFKINDGTWSNPDANFGSNGSQLVVGTEYVMAVGGSSGNISMAGNIENPHIVFTPATATLLITGQEVEADSKYAIHGQIFNGTDWVSVDMVKGDGGTWTYTSDIVPGEFGIKVLDATSGSQTDWYSSADESNQIGADQLGAVLNVKSEGQNWKSSITGNVTFTFDPKAMTLVISGEGSSPEPDPMVIPDALYVIGNLLNGEWNTLTGAVPLVKNGSLFTIENLEIVVPTTGGDYGFFTFITTTGATWDDVNASNRFGAATVDEIITPDAPATVVYYAANFNSSDSKSWGVIPGIYNISVNLDSMTLTIEKPESGIDGIESESNQPATYYNLQGIEVAQPAPGLYIQRQGNTARKIVIR